ncbi:AraC-like DNA-binding protein [Acidovorax sp. 100]|uniref:helix-turn-helix domain-containing protein n=1 Tax=Acidovorax sp. 100 TaxID=2135635 RepID=UPI000F1216B8|nr:AraC-like DNA-binding protein [Acidovorax sp. 100]
MEWSLGQRGWSSLRERAVLDHCFVKMQLEWAHSGRERMWVRHRDVGALKVNNVRGDSVRLYRTRRFAELDNCSVVFLNLVLAGSGRIEQAGRSHRAEAGELMLFDGMQPFVVEGCGPDAHMLVVRIPYEEFGRGITQLREQCAVHVGTKSPWIHECIAGVLAPLCKWHGEVDGTTGEAVAQAVVALLSAVSHAVPEPCASQEGDARRLRRFIQDNYSNVNLTPSDISSALGLPLRRLHLLCAAKETSCMEMIYAQRLERARAVLLTQSTSRRSMLEVAHACGFSSAAHFSRRFARHFGYSPNALKILKHQRMNSGIESVESGVLGGGIR